LAARGFLTVPEDLLECAEAIATWYEVHGYSVKVEPSDAAYPYTPTLRCRRPPTTVIVDVAKHVRLDRADEWSRYGRSCTKDTRIVVGVPDTVARSNEIDARLQELGVGLFVAGETPAREVLLAQDLAVNVQLPTLGSLPRRLRPLLGPVYEQFHRSHWREGFEDACQVLQVEGAKYLARGMHSGRIVVLDSIGRRRRLTQDQIERMTLGQLGVAFANIQTPNHPDTVIATVLVQINKDRVGVAHKKRKSSTEVRLRRNVGQHMWRVVTALKSLLGVR
jgi:hypothetical protein